MDLTTMKQQWLEAAGRAHELVTSLPAGDLGCLYLSNLGEPVGPDPRNNDFGGLIRHYGTLRGAWPTVVPWNGCSKYRKARIITHHVEFILIFFSPTASFCWLHGHHGVAKRLAG